MRHLQPTSQKLRRAMIERATRRAIEPLNILNDLAVVTFIVSATGFVRFQYFDPLDGFTLLSAIQLIITTIAMAFVPFFFGAILTLELARRRLESMTEG